MLNKILIMGLTIFCAGQAVAVSDISIPPAKEASVLVDKILKAANAQDQDFHAEGCDAVPTEDWLKLLLANQPIHHTFVLKKNCDVKGPVILKKDASPIDLSLRHLEGVDEIKVTLVSELNPQLTSGKIEIAVTGFNGKLLNFKTNVLSFHLKYKIVLNIKGEVKQNRSGILYVDAYKGQAMKFERPFQVD